MIAEIQTSIESKRAASKRFDDRFNIQLTLELRMSDYTLFSEHMTSLLDYSRGGGKPSAVAAVSLSKSHDVESPGLALFPLTSLLISTDRYEINLNYVSYSIQHAKWIWNFQ